MALTVEMVWTCCRWNAPGFKNGLAMESSQRLPRKAVVWRSTVTISSSSSAGVPVKKHGWPNLGRHAEVNHPDFTGTDHGHRHPPSDRASLRRPVLPGCRVQYPGS